ncbi:ABC-2 type transport system ATP-binding protein [Paenibacillus sp. UNCCL117]|uniref:ABC transporter ATP-binding protein n=1 Tax=unclassified Paenibacillus TaxID=185978 RepID=UPI000890F9DB|nr:MULTISPECIES: ABC transporter ATP-binding protein [unclassified Paenibacillus]SDD61603.1 ABC-2 type transport system ATP-binding protein [Paenibacillus sp. cl123]SFW67533.1 ABC-2 type transport system ATP-binding protein [Paenibacillus sp. UNCCL117]
MEALLHVEHLTGGYSKQRPVLHDIGFTVKPGEMVGLIGLNGAGKSTTIKHILGLMEPHSGTVRLGGRLLKDDPTSYRRTYAYVPETPLLYEELTVSEHLEMAAMAYGLSRDTYEQRAAILLEDFQMAPFHNRLSAHLSKGMKQKVMIMSAFLVKPDLYIIDEPFLGLDPLGIRSLLELMAKVKSDGAAILISSHILSTIERYGDRYVVLHQGRLAAYGDLETLRSAARMPGAPLDDVFCSLVTQDVNAR